MLIGSLIDAVLNEVLIGTYRAHYNALDSGISDTSNVITLQYKVDGLGGNSYVEIGQELMYVVPGGVAATAKQLTVLRGVRGTVAASHAGGDGVNINPRFPRNAILNTMIEEALSWPTALYQVGVVENIDTLVDTAIDIAAISTFDDIIRIIQVWRQSARPSSTRWVRVSGWRSEVGLFGPGSADLYLASSTSSNIRVLYARPFNDVELWDEASDIIDSGMRPSYGDILKYGAAYRLTTGRESRRLFTEVESEARVAADVPATAAMTLGRQLQAFRNVRLGEEIMRLRSLYGMRGI